MGLVIHINKQINFYSLLVKMVMYVIKPSLTDEFLFCVREVNLNESSFISLSLNGFPCITKEGDEDFYHLEI